MTREEGLDWLYRLRSEIYVYMAKEWLIPMDNAIDMAIKVLEHPEKNVLAVVPCGDAISRAEVLKLMQDNWHTHNADWAMQESMDDIRALPSVTPQEPIWISVSERLPEKDGEYLLWGKICEDEENNYCFIGEYDSCAEEFGYWSDHYDSSTLGFLDSEHIEYHKVLAWMPLPKTYEPQESEGNE